MDISLCCELLNDVLKHPHLDKHRSVYIDHINSDWIGTLHVLNSKLVLAIIIIIIILKTIVFHILDNDFVHNIIIHVTH